MKEIIQTKMIDRSMPSSSTLVSSATVSSTSVSSTVVSSIQHFNFNKGMQILGKSKFNNVGNRSKNVE